MYTILLTTEDREEVSLVTLGLIEIIMTLLLLAAITAIVLVVRRSRRR